jgi:hypothetical protein
MRYSLLLVPSLLLAAACGGSDSSTGPINVNDSSFSANFTGAVTRTVTGKAGFAVETAGEDQGFGLVLGMNAQGSGDPTNVLFYRDQAVRPGNGAYTLADISEDSDIPADQIAAVVLIDATGGNNGKLCVSTGGTFTVTESSANRLKGTYTVQAECLTIDEEAPEVLTVTGSFNAVGGTVSAGN